MASTSVSGLSQQSLLMIECPVCKAGLQFISNNSLQCTKCEGQYPLRQGIPVLLPSEAGCGAPLQSEGAPSASFPQSAKEDIESEARHFDEYYRETRTRKNPLDSMWIARAIHPDSRPLDYWEYVFHLVGDVKGKKVLEFGCGGGWISRLLAYKGAIISAFDISIEGCVSTREKLLDAGFAFDTIAVMDAHATAFRSGSFDLILMAGVLHHLNMEKVAPEAQRLLKPGGKVVGYEPLKWGPVMLALRQLWLKVNNAKEYETTEHEEALSENDFAVFHRTFSRGFTRKFNFVGKTNRLRKRFGPLAVALRWIDYIFLSAFPFLRRYCTTIVLYFEK